jgi:membrane dipeptidase
MINRDLSQLCVPADELAGFMREFRELMPKGALSDYVDNIDYLVNRIGVDHVGIGTDFNHGAGLVGFNDESEAASVTRELAQRGYSEEQIRKIWGGNFLRVFRRVQAVAGQTRAAGS